MTIAEDASTPTPTHKAAGSSGSVTSVSFSPPANSMVVVMVNAMYYNGVSSPSFTCADSLSNSYTQGCFVNSSSQCSTAAIFFHYYTTAPGSITVTVNNSSSASAAYYLAPRVVTGVSSTNSGAASGTLNNYMSSNITTTVSGSWVYVIAGNNENQSQTPTSATTTIDFWRDSKTTDTTYSGRMTNATVTPGSVDLGWGDSGTWAALEILPSTGAGHSAGGNVTFSPVSAAASATFTAGTSGAIVQQVQGASTYDYGWSTTDISTSAGNTLIVIAGWNLNTAFSSAPMPAVYVLDDAYNRWEHVATTSSSNTGSRCAVWVCSGARPVSWISCSLTTFASSLAYTIIELGNMSPFYSLDVVSSTSVSSGKTISTSTLTATTQDVVFTVAAVGSTSAAVTASPSGWTALTGASSGSAGANSIAVYPYYKSSVNKGASIASSYTLSVDSPISSITFALVKNAYAPVQLNPNAPVLKVEMGFGFLPGDPSQSPPVWTDITARTIAGPGEQYVNSSFGRTYELTSQEAGTVTLGIDNHDGAFTPGNVNSPFYPNVLVGTPVRVSAFWADNTTEFWDFEDDRTDGWTTYRSTVTPSSVWSNTGFYSLQITADSSTKTQWYAISPSIPVSPLVSINANAQIYTPVGLGSVHININFYDSTSTQVGNIAGTPISTNNRSVNQIAVSGTTPANAVSCEVLIVDGENSPLGTTMYADTITLTIQSGGPGNWYPIGFGYVERWPQEWPDMPQWGLSKMVASDLFGVLNNAVMMEALDGDILLDGPYVYIPCSDQYSTTVNGLEPIFTASEAQGLLAANYSRLNQRPGMYVDGTAAQASTGSSTVMLGDQNTGFGTTSISSVPTAPTSGPGMIYQDAALLGPGSSPNGITVEFWVTISSNVTSTLLQPTIFSAFFAPSNYEVSAPSLTIQVLNLTSNNNLKVIFRDGSSITATFSPSNNSQQIAFTATTTSFSLYINGALATSTSLTPAQVGDWNAIVLGCANYAFQNANLVAGNFTAMALAVYNYILPMQRIVSHYTTGVTGQENSDATTRIAQVLSWSFMGLPRGGPVTFNGISDGVAEGPAYGLNGSHVADVINQVATNHQALVFSGPDGTLRYLHRWALYNLPSQVTFGDNPSLGEIPFTGDQAFSYDNTYLYNLDSVTQTSGPTQGVTVQAADFNSRSQYYERSALQIGIQTMSNLDAYDTANWAVFSYSQPSIRVRNLTVDAASNPSSFLSILQIHQGTSATVTRRPMGAAPISVPVMVQKVTHVIGPGMWTAKFEMSPYTSMSEVLTLGTSNNVLGSNVLS